MTEPQSPTGSTDATGITGATGHVDIRLTTLECMREEIADLHEKWGRMIFDMISAPREALSQESRACTAFELHLKRAMITGESIVEVKVSRDFGVLKLNVKNV